MRRRRKRCPECRKLVELRPDGTPKTHSATWKNPPPGAPRCLGFETRRLDKSA